MLHGSLSATRWQQLSRIQQMANIGSEVERAVTFQERADDRMQAAFERALELIDLSLADDKWGAGRKELARLREVLCDLFTGASEYGNDSQWLSRYFMPFYLAARS